jgi:RHS repeat-associated protein
VTESIDGADSRSFTYDSIGRVSNQANALGAFTYQFAGSSNRLQVLTEPVQKFNLSYYGATGDFRLQQIQQTANSATVSDSYTYDAMGNILSWRQQNPTDGTATWSLKYDADNELQSGTSHVSDSSGGLNLATSSYQYDPGANLTQFATNSPLTALTATVYQVNKLNQVTSVTGTNYSGSISYDANGNPTNGIGAPSANPNTVTGARSYAWDGANRLVQIIYGSGTSNSTTLGYDGLGRLVQIVETVNGVEQNAELFVWIGNAIVEQRNAAGGVLKAYSDQGFLDGATAYYYGVDHLGSVRNLIDSTGTMRTQLDYGPYGELTELSGQTLPDFAYTGLLYHQRSGLYLAKYRAHDSGQKRWLNRDPILENGGINLYDYVSNNPLRFVDTDGEDSNATGGGDSGSKNGPFGRKPPCQGSQPNQGGKNGDFNPRPGTGGSPPSGQTPIGGGTSGSGNGPFHGHQNGQ